ncbi:MAG: hypothetical protein ACFFC3_11120 [Candidatus Odinarchaeota archaeon]
MCIELYPNSGRDKYQRFRTKDKPIILRDRIMQKNNDGKTMDLS